MTPSHHTSSPELEAAAERSVVTSGRVSSAEAGRLAKRAASASVGVAAFLIVIKAAAFVLTGSVALLGSLIDSVLDAAASALNLVAVRQASTPADRDHRFGHGKAEAIAGLGQAALIAGSAVFLAFESMRRLVVPQTVGATWIGLGVIAVSIILTIALIGYQRFVIKRTGSLAIAADSVHYGSDLFVNLGVVVALVLAGVFGLARADAVIGFAIAVAIGIASWRIIRGAFDQLMDRELADKERARIRTIASAHPEVRSMHDLRTRMSGYDMFIQLHLEMDPALPLERAHEIADEVEAEILAAFPGAQVFIHQDPVGLEEPPVFPSAN